MTSCNKLFKLKTCSKSVVLIVFYFHCSYEKVSESDRQVHVKFNNNGLIITKKPLRLDFLVDNQIAVSVNSKGLMNFEHYQAKKP